MANPGHALAASNSADITVLRTELNQVKIQHQMAMTQLSRGMKELTDLLISKGVVAKNDIEGLSSLMVFMSMSHQQNLW